MKENLITRIENLKKVLESGNFDQKDVKNFCVIFKDLKEYKAFHKVSYLTIHEKPRMSITFSGIDIKNEEFKIIDYDKEFPDLFYAFLASDILDIAKRYNFELSNQTIREMIACMFCILQFTQKTKSSYNCLIKYHNTLALATMRVGGQTVSPYSLILNDKFYEEHTNEFIRERVRAKRIDGKLKIINFEGNVLFEI